MIDRFPEFAQWVATSFQSVIENGAYVTAVDGDVLYERYLSAFPEGTNPKFKERAEHDCSCCKSFIRHVGSVVKVDHNGKLVTIWDEAAESAPAPYNGVAQALRNLVLDARIANVFRVNQNEGSFGAQKSHSLDKESGQALTWSHFYTGTIPKKFRVDSPAEVCGNIRTTVQVFERGLVELESHAVDTVLALIDANNLYRGAEYREHVVQFKNAQEQYAKMTPMARAVFVWTDSTGPASRFRNTVIGTLVQDLSAGMDVEDAVKAFETKVAPQNYKRTTAVITPDMVKKAMETIAELDLEPALERRFARIDDISVRDVLWVDSGVKPLMKGGLGDVLMQHATPSKNATDEEDKAEPIALDKFIKDVLPETTSMELFFKGAHAGNLMSLTAPVHPEPKQLFRWTNDFAFSYVGNVADSIKERVKKAGGKIDAPLRVSLAWRNGDDLDLHVYEPEGSTLRGRMGANHIGYNAGYRKDRGNLFSPCGGQLDVDMNAGGPNNSEDPVENIYWKTVHPGTYKVKVNQFCKRSGSDVGFTVEIECNGKVSTFTYNKAVRDGVFIDVVTMLVDKNGTASFAVCDDAITTSSVSQEKWGLNTEQYVKVSAVTLSPNYWGDNAVGNKHTFFLLDGAKNDEACRGIYNEFLHPRLEQHRKVFEVIGDKTKCQPTDGQLSGLGFSSTKKDSVVVKVTQGKKQRLFNVQIGA